MFDGLFIVSLIGTFVQAIKEACKPTIPSENWGNKELYYKDTMDGVSIEERMKNLKDGKYKLTEVYPEPHRTEDGKIIIENNLLYEEDLRKYGAYQTMQWVKQGKYNLSPEELEKEHQRLKNVYER